MSSGRLTSARTGVLSSPPFRRQPIVAQLARGHSPARGRPATDRPRPARGRPPADAAAARHRAGVEGAAAPLGPRLPPHVQLPRDVPGSLGPCLHRALQPAGRCRLRSLQRTRDDAPPGLCRGPRRRRQRPQSDGSPADGRQARPAVTASPDDAHEPAPCRVLAGRGSLDASSPPWPSSVPARPMSPCREPVACRSRRRCRPRSPWPSIRAPWPRSSSCAPRSVPTIRPTGS